MYVLKCFWFFSFLLIGCGHAKEWCYLLTEPLKARYATAAYYLSNCEEIIEIGGYKTPIDLFLFDKNQKVYVIDPLIDFLETDNIKHYNRTLKDFIGFVPKKSYGVLVMGVDLYDMNSETYKYLYELIDKSKVTILEFASCWDLGRSQFQKILYNTNKKIAFSVLFDFSKNSLEQSDNCWPARPRREMYILK